MIDDWRFRHTPRKAPDVTQAEAGKLSRRLTVFALGVIRLMRVLRSDFASQHMGRQMLRAGTSGAANYRAACRARSRADFVSKVGIALEETDEAAFWIELLVESDLVDVSKARWLASEGEELVAILAASRKTAQTGSAGPG